MTNDHHSEVYLHSEVHFVLTVAFGDLPLPAIPTTLSIAKGWEGAGQDDARPVQGRRTQVVEVVDWLRWTPALCR